MNDEFRNIAEREMADEEKKEPKGETAGAPEEVEGEGQTGERPLSEELDRVQRELDQYVDLTRRARADYANLEKRVQQQGRTVRAEAQAQMAVDFLAILDDLERALSHVGEDEAQKPVVAGIVLVRDKFLATLAKYGIRPIEAMGREFNPQMHHAVAQQPTDAAKPGTVLAVAAAGYMAGDKLLRPAEVVVAVPARPQESEAPTEG